MMNRLDNILEPDFEERGMPRPTSVARHVMSTTPKKDTFGFIFKYSDIYKMNTKISTENIEL